MTARRLFRLLLRILPFDFRADYGREIEQTFLDQRRDARGPAARLRVWVDNLAALAAVGPREHAALALVAVGGVAGLSAAALVTTSFAGLLFAVGPRDMGVFAAVAGLLAAAGTAATLVPAWRATRVDPLVALRRE